MRNKITTLLAAVVVLALAGAALAQPGNSFAEADFVAELSGDNEVPPVETNTTGEAKFTHDGDTLHFELEIQDGEDIVAGAGAHIHCGAPGVNGPIAAYLANGIPPASEDPEEDPPPAGFDGDITIKASLNDQNVEATPCGDKLAALIQSMRDGNTYVNVHSVANPGGEIRGQIEPTG